MLKIADDPTKLLKKKDGTLPKTDDPAKSMKLNGLFYIGH